MLFSSLRDCSYRFIGVRSGLSSFSDLGYLGDLAQRTTAKAPAFPVPESLASERIRILHEYCWRGAEDSDFFRYDYCYISWPQCMYRGAHSVLKHRLGATNVAAFITKRVGLLRSQRSVRAFGGRRLWRGPSAAEVASLGWLLGRAVCDAGYGLRRTPLLDTWVNRTLEGLGCS